MGCVNTSKNSKQVIVASTSRTPDHNRKEELQSISQIQLGNKEQIPNSYLEEEKKCDKEEKYSKKQSIRVDLLSTASKLKEMKSLADIDDIKITRNINKNTNSVQTDYSVLSKIGKGSFGSVFKVHHKKTGHFHAMKVIKRETINLQDDDKKFLKEIEILIKADHPNIIRIYEYFIDDVNYYVIMELVSGGELYDTITSWKDFNEKKAAYIMKQILSAVAYLHSLNIIHRDLKPENMLVENKSKNKRGDEEVNIKIIDFGTCNFLEKNTKLSLKVGSPYYIAPEVLARNYNEKCDIWSCGVILFVLLVGYPPFTGNSTDDLLKNVSKGHYSMDGIYWKNISKEAKDLVAGMLEFSPKKRLSAEDCLKSKWIASNSNSTVSDHVLFKDVLKNMKNFDAGEKFQQATIAYIVHFLYPSSEIEELKKVFKAIDKNGDGRITYDELTKCFETVFGKEIVGVELNKIIEEIDGDADGFISYEEFLRVSINKTKLLEEKNLKIAFETFDLNKDGKLSADEIKQVLGTNHKEYVLHLIAAIDEDNNQQIDFEEFKRLMTSMLENKRDTLIEIENKSIIEREAYKMTTKEEDLQVDNQKKDSKSKVKPPSKFQSSKEFKKNKET